MNHELEAMQYYYRERMHRYPASLHVGFGQWVEDECESEGMTVSEFASHCVECLRIEREDTGVTCPLCGAGFEFGTQQGIDASQVHICGATS